MKSRDPTVWMWSEALALLERADSMQRQFFQLGAHPNACPTWEPPADIFETEQQFVIVVALPGVSADQLVISQDESAITVRGQRALPLSGNNAHIHRVEIPYGRFERRFELPMRQLSVGQRALLDGCLVLTLDKPGAQK